MTPEPLTVPVIDLFAGPGGLSEGFSRFSEFAGDPTNYVVKLSIEKEDPATRTLRLRAFYRQFQANEVPPVYYQYICAKTSEARQELLREIKKYPEWRRAVAEVWKLELGEDNDEQFFKLHRRIKRRIEGAQYWVLLGGPPCQAYSTVGRARRLGNGRDLRQQLSEREIIERSQQRKSDFFSDEKHTLYREYLEIVALHQPPVFVMENVKGILSSTAPASGSGDEPKRDRIFDRILRDMRDPWSAISIDELPSGWEAISDHRRLGYEIYSFTTPPNPITGDHTPQDYLIRAEEHGIPQERHRVILLGVRQDLDAIPVPLAPSATRVSIKDVIGDLPKVRSGRSGRTLSGKRERNPDSAESWVQAVRASLPEDRLEEIQPEEVRQLVSSVLSELSPCLTRGAPFIIKRNKLARPSSELRRWLSDENIGGITQHETREHMDADFARYVFVAAYGHVMGHSPKIRHFPHFLLPHHENVRSPNGAPTGSKVFHDRFRVQVAKRPATTIMSHIRKDGHYYVHYDPTQCRSLTVREAARVQTFPDNYFFEGNRTDQYEQVGNAVPPYLAYKLAGVVAEVIEQAQLSAREMKQVLGHDRRSRSRGYSRKLARVGRP